MSPGRMTPLTTPVFSCCEWFFSSVVSEMTPCSREGTLVRTHGSTSDTSPDVVKYTSSVMPPSSPGT